MKPGRVTKLDKGNKTPSKTVDADAMSENYKVIVIFPICGQFRAIWKPDSGRIIYETYSFVNSNLLSYKN